MQLLDLDEITSTWHISPHSVYKAVARGELRAYGRPGRQKYYSMAELVDCFGEPPDGSAPVTPIRERPQLPGSGSVTPRRELRHRAGRPAAVAARLDGDTESAGHENSGGLISVSRTIRVARQPDDLRGNDCSPQQLDWVEDAA